MPYNPYQSPEELAALAEESGMWPYATGSPSVAPVEPSFALNRQNYQGLTPPEGMTEPAPSVLRPPQETGGGTSTSQSYTGPGGAQARKRVSQGDQELNSDLVNAETQARNSMAPALTKLDEAGASNKEAAHQVVDAQAAKLLQAGREAQLFAKLQDGFGAEEARINADANALSNQSKADYMAALASYRASGVNPNELWQSNSTGMQVGMLAAAFAHDFLGAKGIKTSALDTLNKAIDRNISAQVENIKIKGEVADGFKSLWWMQRNQSASDAEARTRVRGFLLDGFKSAVTAHMAPFESALATAEGQAAIAKIDEEFAKNYIEVYKHIDSNVAALRGQALDRWSTKLRESRESIAMSQAEKWRQKEWDAKHPTGPQAVDYRGVLIDPETNKGEWILRTDLNDTERAKVRQTLSDKDEVSGDLADLRELMRKAVKTGNTEFDAIQGTRLAGTFAQEYDALAFRIAHGMVKANGEKATDKDVEQYLKSIRAETWLNNAESEKVLAHTQELILKATNRQLRQYMTTLPADDPRRSFEGPTTVPFRGAIRDAQKTQNPEEPSMEKSILDTNLGRVTEPSAQTKEYTANSPEAHRVDKADYERETVAEGGNASDLADHKRFIKEAFGTKAFDTADAGAIKQFESGLSGLKRQAIQGLGQEATPEQRKQGMAAMDQLYIQVQGADNSDDYRAAYSMMMLHDVAEALGRPELDDVPSNKQIEEPSIRTGLSNKPSPQKLPISRPEGYGRIGRYKY